MCWYTHKQHLVKLLIIVAELIGLIMGLFHLSVVHRLLVQMQKKTFNKKSELMLMRHARAHSSSCSQVILVYLHPFHRSSLLCSQKSPKKSPETPTFRVQGQSKSSILTILRSSSLVLVMLSSMSVPICNHFHVRQASSE